MIYLVELDAYDPGAGAVKTLRYSSGTGYQEGRLPVVSATNSGAQTLNPLITFTRSTGATRINELGVMETVPANQPRFDHHPETGAPLGLLVEEARTNLFRSTGNLSGTSGSWGPSNSPGNIARITDDLAPNGTEYFTEIERVNGDWRLSVAITAGATYSGSIYARRGNQPRAGFEIHLTGTSTVAKSISYNFDTGALAVSTDAVGAVQKLSNGTVRLTLTVTDDGDGTSGYMLIATGGTSGAAGSTSRYWGAQFEQGSIATSYIPGAPSFTGRTSAGTYFNSAGVMQTAASGVARFGHFYTGTQWVMPGLMVESFSTNLITNSSTASIFAGGTTTSAPALNGTNTATSYTATGTSNASDGQIQTVTANTTYTYSAYVKRVSTSSPWLRIRFSDGATIRSGFFNTDTGEQGVMEAATGGITSLYFYPPEPAGGGWWRVAVRFNITGTSARFAVGAANADGSTNMTVGDNWHWWGVQLEAGNLSSLIITTGASASRNSDTVTYPTASRGADLASLPLSSFAFNSTAGTLIAEGSRPVIGATTWPWILCAHQSGTDRFGIFHDDFSTDRMTGYVRVGNVAQASIGAGSAIAAGQIARAAFSYEADNFAISSNGSALGLDTSGTLPAGVDSLLIGRGDNYYNGHVRRVAVYGSRRSNADLPALSVAGSALTGAALDLDFLTYSAPVATIANGTYALYVESPSGSEWRTATVSAGSYQVLPVGDSTTVTRYAFYTPLAPGEAAPFYDPRIIEPGNFQRSLFAPGTTGGESSVGAGEIVMLNPDGALDDLLDFGIAGREVRISTISDESTALSSAVRWQTGTADQVEVSWSRVSVRLRDRLELLRAPLQLNRYAGTTITGGMSEAEGQPEDLKGQVKPLLYGEAYNVPAPLANAFDLLYQLHDGALSSISAVYDNGVPLAFSANYASVSALRAASVQGGYYATCLSAGLFKLGSSPAGTVTADAAEGATGSRNAGALALRILAKLGFTAGAWSASTFAALSTAAPADVGIWINQDTTGLEALSAILSGIGAWLLPNRAGIFEVGRLTAPDGTPVAVWTEDEILDRGAGIERIATNDAGAGVPVWRVTVRYLRYYSVQESSQLAGCVAPARRAELASEWRTAVAENASIKTVHLSARELTVDSLLTDEAAAQAEAARLLALYSVRRDRLIVPVDSDLASAVDLGRTVMIRIQRWGYNSGRLMTVIGLSEAAASGVTEIEVWG